MFQYFNKKYNTLRKQTFELKQTKICCEKFISQINFFYSLAWKKTVNYLTFRIKSSYLICRFYHLVIWYLLLGKIII